MPEDLLSPPKPPQDFIGRRSELEQLHRDLYSDERFPAMPFVISGEPGIGKTCLAAEFVSQHQKRREFIWISCTAFDQHKRQIDEEMSSRLRRRSPRQVVVVLDGADALPFDIFNLLFYRVLNFEQVGRIIVTARQPLNLRGESVITLYPFTEAEAEGLIGRQLGSSLPSHETVLKVLKLIKGNPSAISLVSKMAEMMDEPRLLQVLEGNIYDLRNKAAGAEVRIISAARPIIISAGAAMVEAIKKRPREIYKLTPRQFEELLAELFTDLGYEVKLTKATRDGGADLFVYIPTAWGRMLCLVDAKLYREDRKIGVEMVRTLYGTLQHLGANSGMLVTTSGFSSDAHAMQKQYEYQLSLKDYTAVAGWIQKYGSNKD